MLYCRRQSTATLPPLARPFVRITRRAWHDLRPSPRTGRQSNLWGYFDIEVEGKKFENLRICQRFDGKLFLVEKQNPDGSYVYRINDREIRNRIEQVLIAEVEERRRQLNGQLKLLLEEV